MNINYEEKNIRKVWQTHLVNIDSTQNSMISLLIQAYHKSTVLVKIFQKMIKNFNVFITLRNQYKKQLIDFFFLQ